MLCKYGIEYVDDPVSGKKVPTSHRSSFDSVLEDSDFEQACENADAIARRMYRDEAKVIEEIRKGIIEVSGKEVPYDIFICYKETDESGNRTIDSVLAQEVYDALTEKGYRVFFSRITLEDKLGMEYEPYIFAALNSSKVMLVFGTDYENYNAVWVKNEWSRFLKLMAQDKTRYLIPCYKSIDAYDMPKEFAKFQAQDMGKVGAVQDLLRGIEKLLPSKKMHDSEANDDNNDSKKDYYARVDNYLKRGQMHLEDGEWEEAYDCFQKAGFNPGSDYRAIMARVGCICAELEICQIEEFVEDTQIFSKSISCEQAFCLVELKAGHLWLEEGDWERADEHFDKAIEKEPECASAYIGKMMARYHVPCEEDIADILSGKNIDIAADVNYKRALRFADDALKERLIGYQIHSVFEPAVSADEQERLSAVRDRLRQYKGCILAVANNTYALTSYGAVLAVGNNEKGQCNVASWRNVIMIAAGDYHIVGLKKDGTVVAVGAKGTLINRGQCETEKWSDIKAIAASNSFTVGLRTNGSIMTCGDAIKNQNDMSTSYFKGVFRNIVGQAILPKLLEFKAVFVSSRDIYGLNADKTVTAYNYDVCRDWRGIIDIASSQAVHHVIGLKSNRTVVAFGENKYGECAVGKWKDIISAAVGGGLYNGFSIGLRADGAVMAVGSNEHGQCRTSKWRDIVAITAGENHTVGLRSDGTVMAVGSNEYGQCNTSEWRDIVAIAAGENHTVGLKSDGTVVAVGDNRYGQCDTQSWTEIGMEDSEKAAVRVEIEKIRSALMEARAETEKHMNDTIKLRNNMLQNWEMNNVCLRCGKKHVFEVKTCKQCGAEWTRTIGEDGIPRRNYVVRDPMEICIIGKNGYFLIRRLDGGGKQFWTKISEKGAFSECYSDEYGHRISEQRRFIEGIFCIDPAEESGMYRTLDRNGRIEFFHYNGNRQLHGMCKVIEPDGKILTGEYNNGEMVK